jgi:hypothetical protein
MRKHVWSKQKKASLFTPLVLHPPLAHTQLNKTPHGFVTSTGGKLEMAKEAKLEKAIGDFARSNGCLYYKFSSPSNRGVPDRIIIAPTGKILFLEIKAPGEIPTKLQGREMHRINSNNANADWVDNIEKAKQLISKLCESQPKNYGQPSAV